MRCLVTGATGYIGSRLVPELLAEGHEVRCLTRSAGRMRDSPWADRVEIVEGDLTKPATLVGALAGVAVAYYLVHSMGRRGFEAVDRTSATNFSAAAHAAGVRRIVYLSGPRPAESDRGSAHLRSRAEVEQILLDSAVPTVVLRAAVIIGSGSTSFEMLRHLTERLPVMITPYWVNTPVQPIAIRDVLHYLVASVALPGEINRAFDIGGTEVLSYADMIQRYATVASLRPRTILPVSALTPRLSSYWVGLVTPVPATIAKPLVAGLGQEAVAREHDIADQVPDPPGGLTPFDEAVRAALDGERARVDPPLWLRDDRPDLEPAQSRPTDPSWSGATVYTDQRQYTVAAPPGVLWQVVERFGGGPAWYSWRVEDVQPGRLRRLRAEPRLLGRAWQELRVSSADGGSRYVQRTVFLPHGLAGHAYWAAVRPLHAAIFAGMARDIVDAAERSHRAADRSIA